MSWILADVVDITPRFGKTHVRVRLVDGDAEHIGAFKFDGTPSVADIQAEVAKLRDRLNNPPATPAEFVDKIQELLDRGVTRTQIRNKLLEL